MPTITGQIRLDASGRVMLYRTDDVTTARAGLVADDDPNQPCCLRACEDSPNLVTNGGFEDGTGTSGTGTQVTPTSWTVVQGRPSVIRPTVPSPTNDFPDPPEGVQYLSGGLPTGAGTFAALPGVPVAIVEQDIDVSDYSQAIDNEQGCYSFSIYLGTYGEEPVTTPQNDQPKAELIAGGVALKTIGPKPGNVRGFGHYTTGGKLPVGTTEVTIRLTATRDPTVPNNGYFNDAYFDGVDFRVCAVENP